MPTVEQSVNVNVDVATAYHQWTLFESFPQWMEGVASVERTGDTRLHWVAKVREESATVEGETREWDARITGLTQDRRVSWESAGSGPGEKPNAGAAMFAPLTGEAEVPSWKFLALLGLIGGGPTFIGTVVGQAWVNEFVSVAFLTLAAGSILYVVIELLNVNRGFGMKRLVTWGLVAGLLAGFLTDWILVAAGA